LSRRTGDAQSADLWSKKLKHLKIGQIDFLAKAAVSARCCKPIALSDVLATCGDISGCSAAAVEAVLTQQSAAVVC
jgi:hypothetical protein